MAINGESIYQSDLCQPRRSSYATFTRKGNTLYMHVHFWPGEYVAIGGLTTRVKSAKLLKTGAPVTFEQNDWRAKFTGLPMKAPDYPVTTIAIECEGEPTQDNIHARKDKPRDGV